jgi:ABC-type antimicrobial peptide transport system ATPase subunit
MNEDAAHGLAGRVAIPAGEPLLEARNIRRTFGETIALDSCSLAVHPGEIHAVVGENGSGKSTLIKILSGIVPAESGSLQWDGAPVRFRSPSAAQAAGIATVFQETLVLLDMSVRDNVMLGLDGAVHRRASPAREVEMVRDALSVVGLGDLDVERLAGTLSLANRRSRPSLRGAAWLRRGRTLGSLRLAPHGRDREPRRPRDGAPLGTKRGNACDRPFLVGDAA